MIPLADAVLDLMREGDVFRVRNRLFLVAPVNRDQLETLIAAAGSVEDLEENGDREPSIGPHDDLESDGNCDDEPNGDAEPDHDDDGVDGDGGTQWIAVA